MREAYFESGWIADNEGLLLGIRLGYDHCAEHSGAPAAIDMTAKIPSGRADPSSSFIHFERFNQRSFDPAIRPFPVAILVAAQRSTDHSSHIKRLKAMTKVIDPGQGDPPRSMLMTAWGLDGFAIQARGEQGIRHLEVLNKCLTEGRVGVAGVEHEGMFGRSGLSLVIAK